MTGGRWVIATERDNHKISMIWMPIQDAQLYSLRSIRRWQFMALQRLLQRVVVGAEVPNASEGLASTAFRSAS